MVFGFNFFISQEDNSFVNCGYLFKKVIVIIRQIKLKKTAAIIKLTSLVACIMLETPIEFHYKFNSKKMFHDKAKELLLVI